MKSERPVEKGISGQEANDDLENELFVAQRARSSTPTLATCVELTHDRTRFPQLRIAEGMLITPARSNRR